MILSLVNYIGALNIQDNPKSGRFVNDLPGITSNRIEETYDTNDNYTVEEGWQQIERAAIDLFENKLLELAKKYYLQYDHVSSLITSQYDKKEPLATSEEYKGVLLNYNYYSWDNLAFEVDSVNLYAEVAADTTIYAFNASTGDLIYSKDVSLLQGDNKIVTGWHFPVWRYPYVFIAYDAEEVQTIQQSQYGFRWPVGYVNNKRVSKSSQIINGNLITDKEHGLIVTLSVKCSIDNFVSQHLAYFQTPFMYCLASQALRESNRSEAINRFTLFDIQDAEGAESLREQYYNEFVTMLEAALNGLQYPYDQYCFVCNKAVNYRSQIP